MTKFMPSISIGCFVRVLFVFNFLIIGLRYSGHSSFNFDMIFTNTYYLLFTRRSSSVQKNNTY